MLDVTRHGCSIERRISAPANIIKLNYFRSMKTSKTFPIGRDADTGQFVPVKEAREHPRTHTVERMPKPGYGDTDR